MQTTFGTILSSEYVLLPGMDPADVDVGLSPPHPRLWHGIPRQLHRHLLSRLQVAHSLSLSSWTCFFKCT